jgi:Resolvase, N terminal domain
MSEHRILSFKPQLRLEWQSQDGQSETEHPDHSASLSDSITSSTRIRFSVHTGVDFVVADMPNASQLTVGIMAMVAEDETQRISERTKAAFAAAKKRGKKLGGFP